LIELTKINGDRANNSAQTIRGTLQGESRCTSPAPVRFLSGIH
jgi:hypothetical protein